MSILQYEDLTEKVYKAVKEMILTSELPPGMKLLQEELSERLGVSRTPLLAAFSKLEKEMLIEMIPRRGAYVRRCSLEEMYDFADVRIRLEPLGARNAAIKATPAEREGLMALLARYRHAVAAGDRQEIKESDYYLHMEIMRLSGSKVLHQIVSSFNIVLISNQRGLLKSPQESLVEHELVCLAIARGDADGAEAAMAAHLSGIKTGMAALGDSDGVDDKPGGAP